MRQFLSKLKISMCVCSQSAIPGFISHINLILSLSLFYTFCSRDSLLKTVIQENCSWFRIRCSMLPSVDPWFLSAPQWQMIEINHHLLSSSTQRAQSDHHLVLGHWTSLPNLGGSGINTASPQPPLSIIFKRCFVTAKHHRQRPIKRSCLVKRLLSWKWA